MEKQKKFALPSPNFGSNLKESLKPKPHFLTPCGMTLLPREKQPPPMYGLRGPTLPAKYMQNQHQQNYKNKKMPETQQMERQFCEPCEMELQSPEDLRRHRAQHENCPVDGCSYRGHASVMDKHVGTLHATGLFDTFKKLSTPEEIAAWREERRKKYPTVSNVQMRKRAQEQREKRGERLGANQSRFGKREDRKRIQKGNGEEQRNNEKHGQAREGGMHRGKRNERKMNKRRKVQAENQEIKQNAETPNNIKEENNKALMTENIQEIQCGGVCMFRGTSTLKDYKRVQAKSEVKTNALSGLLGMYGSDEDDDEEDNTVEIEACGVNENLAAKEIDVADNNAVESIIGIEQGNSSTSCAEYQANNQVELIEAPDPPLSEIKTDKQQHEIPSKEIIMHENCTNDRSEEVAKVNASSDEAPEEVPIEHTSDFPMRTRATKPIETNIGESKNKTKKGESKTDNTSKRPKMQDLPRSARQSSKRKSGLDYRKARMRKQNTMLEKLLEPDIRHERNVLLQCVRYVCENKFFGIGETKKQ